MTFLLKLDKIIKWLSVKTGGFFKGQMVQERGIQRDLSAHQETEACNVTDIVSPFEIPEPSGPVVDPIGEKLKRSHVFAARQKHALSNHYPLRHRRSKVIVEDPIKAETYNRHFSTQQVRSLEEEDLTRPDPDFSCLEFRPPASHESGVFIAARDLQEIMSIIKKSSAVLDEDEVDPEITEAFMEDCSRGTTGGPEPMQITSLLFVNPRHCMSPVEDSYDHESKP